MGILVCAWERQAGQGDYGENKEKDREGEAQLDWSIKSIKGNGKWGWKGVLGLVQGEIAFFWPTQAE